MSIFDDLYVSDEITVEPLMFRYDRINHELFVFHHGLSFFAGPFDDDDWAAFLVATGGGE